MGCLALQGAVIISLSDISLSFTHTGGYRLFNTIIFPPPYIQYKAWVKTHGLSMFFNKMSVIVFVMSFKIHLLLDHVTLDVCLLLPWTYFLQLKWCRPLLIYHSDLLCLAMYIMSSTTITTFHDQSVTFSMHLANSLQCLHCLIYILIHFRDLSFSLPLAMGRLVRY